MVNSNTGGARIVIYKSKTSWPNTTENLFNRIMQSFSEISVTLCKNICYHIIQEIKGYFNTTATAKKP